MKKILLPVLFASVFLNAYFFFSKNEILAVAGGHRLAIGDLQPAARAALKREAEIWVEKVVLAKEASGRSTTPERLLKEEVLDKVQVSEEEIFRRYVASPAADRLPWPEALKGIEKAIFDERAGERKKIFLRSLFPKYGAVFYFDAPDEETASVSGPFPVYQSPPAVPDRSEGNVTGPPARGEDSAPVRMEVYSDFMCPYSHLFFETLRSLSRQYPDKLRVLFRHFPLPFHEGAHLMAEASVCAQEQGKFWEYHDRLMEADSGKKDKAALAQLAQELGLDTEKFQGCVDSGKYVAWVDSEIKSGKQSGVSGTPGFLINGRLGFGAMPQENLKAMIDWHLKPEGQYPGSRTFQKKE